MKTLFLWFDLLDRDDFKYTPLELIFSNQLLFFSRKFYQTTI